MKVSGYLIILGSKSRYSSYYSGSARWVSKKPKTLNGCEIAVKVDVNVPDTFFERMTPTIVIDIPQEAVIVPDTSAVIHITANAVGDSLKIDAGAVRDALTQIVEAQQQKGNSSVESSDKTP